MSLPLNRRREDGSPARASSAVLPWLGVFAVCLVLWALRHLLAPVLLAALLAYLLNPLIVISQGAAIRRELAVNALFAVLVGGFLALAFAVGPAAKAQLAELFRDLPKLEGQIDRMASVAHRESMRSFPLLARVFPSAKEGESLTRQLLGGGEGAGVGAILLPLGKIVLFAVLTPFFAFFFLRDSRRLQNGLMNLLPPRHVETSVSLWCEVDGIVGRYLRGVALDAVAVAILSSLALWAVGIPYPLVLGILTGAANVVPFLGPLLGFAASSLVAVTQGLGLEGVGRVALVFVVLKLVDDMILQPLTIGRSVHQHPVLVIVSILAGEQLLGVLGMFIAVPFVTMVKETIRILLERRKRGRPEAVQELEGVPQYLC